MRYIIVAAASIAILAAACGCRNAGSGTAEAVGDDNAGLDARVARLDESLARPLPDDAASEPIARWILPAGLAEISGLALTPDGRLFAHNDETARITELDYRRGSVTKQFSVGQPLLRGDFEGLACVGDRFFLLRSDGTLYEFEEGAADERVAYTTHDAHLGKECEFEGVAYDSTTSSLILTCKNVGVKQYKDMLVFYRYALDDPGTGELVELTVPQDVAIDGNEWKLLHPTDLTVDPFTGNYVFVAAQEKALVALTPDGSVVFSRSLVGKHPQAEGLAITRDGILIISDESVSAAATITLYRWH
jgi:uncharacterized protein YjiK